MTVPALFSKLPPTAKFPLGSVTEPAVITTEPVEVALVSDMVKVPAPVKASEATVELLNRTVCAPVPVKTNGLPLLVNEPPVALKVAPIVVVPVGKVTAPAD